MTPYWEYLIECERRQVTPWAIDTFRKKRNSQRVNFWNNHNGYSYEEIEKKQELLFDKWDRWYMSTLWKYHTKKKKSNMDQYMVLFWKIYFLRKKRNGFKKITDNRW